jgi:hypothetical protein
VDRLATVNDNLVTDKFNDRCPALHNALRELERIQPDYAAPVRPVSRDAEHALAISYSCLTCPFIGRRRWMSDG